MFKINRKIEYALIALKHMHGKDPGSRVSAKEICDVYQTPFDPMSRVLQLLAQKGILNAEHGAKGGYQLIKDLSQVSLYDLTLIIVGPIEIANCFSGDFSRCEMTGCCNVIAPMVHFNEKLHEFLKTIKVKDLISSTHTREKVIRSKPVKV